MPVAQKINQNHVWYRQFDKSTLFFQGEVKQTDDGIMTRSRPLNSKRTKADRKWKVCGCIIRGDGVTIRHCSMKEHHVNRTLSGREVSSRNESV